LIHELHFLPNFSFNFISKFHGRSQTSELFLIISVRKVLHHFPKMFSDQIIFKMLNALFFFKKKEKEEL